MGYFVDAVTVVFLGELLREAQTERAKFRRALMEIAITYTNTKKTEGEIALLMANIARKALELGEEDGR